MYNLDSSMKFLEHVEWGWAVCNVKRDASDHPAKCEPGRMSFVDSTKRGNDRMSPRDAALFTNMKKDFPRAWVTFAERFLQ